MESRRHKEAQDTILRSGHALTLTVRRGSVLSQAVRPPGGRHTPVLGGTQQADWDTVLQADKAGAAGNAQDFTQEFMSQLRGKSTSNIPPAMLGNNVNNGQNTQNNHHQQDPAVRMSTPKHVRNANKRSSTFTSLMFLDVVYLSGCFPSIHSLPTILLHQAPRLFTRRESHTRHFQIRNQKDRKFQ